MQFSPCSVCTEGNDRGVHWVEGQLLYLALVLTSVPLSLLYTQLQVRYAAGTWTLLIQFQRIYSTYTEEKKNKVINVF